MKLPKIQYNHLKIAAFIVVAILLIVVGIKLFGKNSFITKLLNGFTNEDEKKAAGQRSDNTDRPRTRFMSFNLTKAKFYADSLELAMNPHKGFMPASYDGTDEQAIYEVFAEIKNRDDMLAVYRAFDARDYDRGLFTSMFKDLIGWLKNDLSEEDYKKVEPKIKLI